MTDDPTPIQDQMPCANGCIRKGTEGTDHPELLPARRGNFCKRCYGKLDNALHIAPTVIEHVVSLLGSKGGSDDKVDNANGEAPTPFNSMAFNDANEIYQRLVYWSVLWAERLHVQAPGPAVRAWRARSGFVVGLPADVAPGSARYLSGVMATWLQIHLEQICYLDALDDINYFGDELKDVYRINARWPQESKPRYSEMPCPNGSCGGKVAVYPPESFGDDERIVCERCGYRIMPNRYDAYVHHYNEIQAERDPVKRHLMTKYGKIA